jgi:DNA polymerase
MCAAKADESSAAPVPESRDLEDLRVAASSCRACDLWKSGTQTVFGEGDQTARLLLVGEQPGDVEDRAGRPFVGPAGRLLDEALEQAGIDRRQVYVTNAVKHFKWEGRGRRRIHKKPNAREVAACRPWLEAEIEATRPDVIVCLGATAAQALLGAGFRLTHHRGEPLKTPLSRWIVATAHPSSVLRAPDSASRRRGMEALVGDLRRVRELLQANERRSA